MKRIDRKSALEEKTIIPELRTVRVEPGPIFVEVHFMELNGLHFQDKWYRALITAINKDLSKMLVRIEQGPKKGEEMWLHGLDRGNTWRDLL